MRTRRRVGSRTLLAALAACAVFATQNPSCERFMKDYTQSQPPEKPAIADPLFRTELNAAFINFIDPLDNYSKSHHDRYPVAPRDAFTGDAQKTWPVNPFTGKEVQIVPWDSTSEGDLSYWVSRDRKSVCLAIHGKKGAFSTEGRANDGAKGYANFYEFNPPGVMKERDPTAPLPCKVRGVIMAYGSTKEEVEAFKKGKYHEENGKVRDAAYAIVAAINNYRPERGNLYPKNIGELEKAHFLKPVPENPFKPGKQIEQVPWGQRSSGNFYYWVSPTRKSYCLLAYFGKGADVSKVWGDVVVALGWPDGGSASFFSPDYETARPSLKSVRPGFEPGAPGVCSEQEPAQNQ